MSRSHLNAPLMTIDLVDLDFISKRKYAPPGEIQIERDWVRNQKVISVSDASGTEIPLATLVAKKAQNKLYELLKHYRDQGWGNAGNRLELLGELYRCVRHYAETYIALYKKSTPEKQAHCQHLQALLDQVDNLSVVPDLQNDDYLAASIPLMYQNLSMARISYDLKQIEEFRPKPGLFDKQEFRDFDKLLKSMQNFFISENSDTIEVIKQIWQDDVLKDITTDADKQAIISQLKLSAHQGGFFFSTQTMFQEYVGRNKLENGNVAYTIYGQDCAESANARFYVEEGKLFVDETIQIKRILDESTVDYIANEDDTPIFVLHIQHCISPQSNGTAKLDIIDARVDVYNEQAWNVTNHGFAIQKEKLLSYAQKYLERGHDESQYDFFKEFDARILHCEPVAVPYTLARDSNITAEKREYGDKILRYAGISFPQFAEGIAARVSSAQTAEQFLAMIELLQRMDRTELAASIIQPYAKNLLVNTEQKNDQIALTEKIDTILSQPDSIRQAFHYLQQRLLLPRSMSKVTAAKPIQKNEKLLYNYLMHYTLHGHDNAKLQAVLAEFPSIVSMEPVEKKRPWSSHPMGDNILEYIEQNHAKFAAQVKEKILLDYASDYITKQRHDDTRIQLFFKLYPDIKKTPTMKNYFFGSPQERGERVLRYIGEKYPEYAQAVFNSLKFLAKKEEYVFAIKLLRRMGQESYALAALQPYAKYYKLVVQNKSNPSEAEIMKEAKVVMENSASVEAAHEYLLANDHLVQSIKAQAQKKFGGK